MQRVKYCTNSTISEAWALIQGLPAPLNDLEDKALLHVAAPQFPNIKKVPSLVFAQTDAGLTAPFWNSQLSWDEGKYQARVGHRYLSAHFIKNSKSKYESYEETLEPQIKKWLELYPKVCQGNRGDYAIGKIASGYINRFEFTRKDFDISEHFNLSVGIETGEVKGDLHEFKSMFRFFDVAESINFSVELSVEEITGSADKLLVTSHVFAEKRELSKLSFLDIAELTKVLRQVKDHAKNAFFEFATQSTKDLMGAKYA